VYRRRRITALVVLLLLVALPWCVSRRGDGDAAAGDAAPPTRRACAAAVDARSLRGRLALTLMVGVDGERPGEAVDHLEAADRPGGIFVRGGATIWEERTLAEPLGDDLPLLVAVDDEGGPVQPMKGVLADLPSAAVLAGEDDDSVRATAEGRATELRELGVNVVLGPVVDVGHAGGIGDRAFGDTSEVVTAKAGAYAAGLRAGGVTPVLKHFPGQGHADADTHEGPAAVPELSLLRSSDLVPYDLLLTEPPTGVMVGHLDVPGLTEQGVPASLSAAAIGLLRSSYEFSGLVITDDLTAMGAVLDRFTVPDAAERALAAGADVLLLANPTDVSAVLDRLEEAVTLGRIPGRRIDSAVARVIAAGCPAG
jgi:beta-N-acetylhexosaminidase